MNSFNTFHSNIITRSNNKIGQMYYRVVSAGLSAMNGTVVNISGFSANGISPGFYSYNPSNLTQTPLASVDSNPRNFDRSYNVLTINRITGATTTTTYDVYNGGTPNPSTTLTTYLNSLTPSVIVVIATYDEPKYETSRNLLPDGLVTAIKRCGGSSNFPSFINLRGAYVLLGIPDIGTNNGIERYVGDNSANGDNNAAIDLRFTVSDGQYSHINYTDNLVLWYTFDSNTVDGTTVRDLMNNYNGTIQQGATFDTVNKTVGTASASFAGMNTSTNTPHIRLATNLPASLTYQNALSFSFWFRSNNTGVFGRIFDFANGAGANNIIAFIYLNNLGFSVYNGNTNTDILNVFPSVNDNVWRHCVWVLTSGTWQIYINGLLHSTRTSVNFPQNIERTVNYIGRSNWPDNAGYNGNIDDFRMYKEALTQEKVSILFSYDRTNYTNNLLLWYKFDSNTVSGTTVIDYTRNYNGTLQNNATISTTTKTKGTASLYLQNTNTQHVSIPTFTVSSSLSFSFWINPAIANNNNCIFDSADAVGPYENNIVIYLQSGNLGFSYNVNRYNERNDWYHSNDLTDIPINTWTHVVIASYPIASNKNTIKIYKNNVLITTKSITPGDANFSAAILPRARESNFIGKTNTSGYNTYSGYIDDFRIYNEVLTEDKIDTLYNNYK
jgi:hypothetical protein